MQITGYTDRENHSIRVGMTLKSITGRFVVVEFDRFLGFVLHEAMYHSKEKLNRFNCRQYQIWKEGGTRHATAI